ncbi:MAG: hypothetical protein U0736_01690 [Gemmataceae bacterium]
MRSAKVGRQGAKAWPDPAVYEQIKTSFEEFRDCLDGLNSEAFAADDDAVRTAVEHGQRYLRVADEGVLTASAAVTASSTFRICWIRESRPASRSPAGPPACRSATGTC